MLISKILNITMSFHYLNITNLKNFSAVYNWKGDVKSGLPLEIGETVQILEENEGNLAVKHIILF